MSSDSMALRACTSYAVNGSGKTTLWRALCWEEMDKMDEP